MKIRDLKVNDVFHFDNDMIFYKVVEVKERIIIVINLEINNREIFFIEDKSNVELI